jgi:hypothetical protein
VQVDRQRVAKYGRADLLPKGDDHEGVGPRRADLVDDARVVDVRRLDRLQALLPGVSPHGSGRELASAAGGAVRLGHHKHHLVWAQQCPQRGQAERT